MNWLKRLLYGNKKNVSSEKEAKPAKIQQLNVDQRWAEILLSLSIADGKSDMRYSMPLEQTLKSIRTNGLYDRFASATVNGSKLSLGRDATYNYEIIRIGKNAFEWITDRLDGRGAYDEPYGGRDPSEF